jgi:hypothetical protein
MRMRADAKRSCFIPIIDLPPWLNEDGTRDRSNRLLGSTLPTKLQNPPLQKNRDNRRHTEYQQKDRKLLVQRVARLSNAHPKIGA